MRNSGKFALRRPLAATSFYALAVMTGHCLCDGVRYEITGEVRPVVNCHCDRCRRTTGHFMAATSCAVTDLAIQETSLSWHAVENVEYGFCSRCGASLFWRATDKPDRISITAGTIDPPTHLETAEALFVSHASDYHVLQDGLVEHDLDWRD